MENKDIDISELTADKLRAISKNQPVEAEIIRKVFSDIFTEIEKQLELIINALDGYTQRAGLLIAIAGLMSFPLTLTSLDVEYTKYFLIWVFPFLICAIGCYYFSSPRISFLAKQVAVTMPTNSEHLPILKAKFDSLKLYWEKSKELHDNATKWYRLTSSLAYIYMSSLVLNYYYFIFIGNVPGFYRANIIAVLSLLIGVAMYFRHKLKSKRNVSFGTFNFPKPPSIS